MNGLTIIVLAVIALCAYNGYKRGLLRVVYSLVSWVLVLGFVTFVTPHVTTFLEENTQIADGIEEKCLEYIQDAGEQKIGELAEEETKSNQEILMQQNMFLPESVVEEFTKAAASGADEILESSGIYETMAASITHFIMQGIAFFVTFILSSICMRSISGMLNTVSRLPIIKDVNRMLGVVAGGIKGILIVWLGFYIVTICITSDWGRQIYTYIEESPILLLLYQNNLLLQLIMIFL